MARRALPFKVVDRYIVEMACCALGWGPGKLLIDVAAGAGCRGMRADKGVEIMLGSTAPRLEFDHINDRRGKGGEQWRCGKRPAC